MQNLAGDPNCDKQIERELTRCGIEIVKGQRSTHEVAASITGKLGNFKFYRAWSYMIVEGKVPLEVARELYNDAAGKTDIRVKGDCGCPPPEEWAVWYDEDGNKLVSKDDEAAFDKYLDTMPNIKNGIRFVDDPTEGKGYVESYHIDSELGLRIFADAIKKHGLDKEEII
jgi:hypothetical protein